MDLADPRIACARHGRRVRHRSRDGARIRPRRRASSSSATSTSAALEGGRGKRSRHRRRASATSPIRAAVARMFDQVTATFGGLDALVNNAGIAGPTAACEDIALADWERTLAVNLTGQFLCAQRAIPWLKKSSNREHRQSFVGRGPLRLSDAHAVRRVQVGRDRAVQVAGDRARPRRRPRQRDLSRVGGRPAHRRGLRQQGGRARRLRGDRARRSARQDIAAAAGLAPTTSPTRSSFSPRLWAPTSRARRCRSMPIRKRWSETFASHRSQRAPRASGVIFQ